jgi:hypothetical protein
MRFRSALLVLASALLASCSSSPTTDATPDPAVGRYLLVQVDSKNVPVTRSSTTVITDGTLFLSNDGTYSSAVHQSVTQNGTTSVTTIGLQSGTWSRLNDATLRLVPFSGVDTGIDASAIMPDLYFYLNGTRYGYRKG